jgi:4-hydroxy-tetrahydrodipicolinate synthase
LAGTANVLPAHHVALMNAANAGDIDKARVAFEAILPWVQHMEEGQYNQKVKLGLLMQGIDLGPVRAPIMALQPDDEAVTRQFVTAALGAPLAG